MRNVHVILLAAAAVACALSVCGCGRGADRGAVAVQSHDAGIRIGPERPDVTSQLEAVVEVNGVDPASCRYEWQRNGERITGETRAVLPPSAFRKDDRVVAIVTVPGSAGGAERTLRAEVRIANAPPSVASAHIEISATTAGTVLRAEQESVDPDGDALANDYRWFENGRLVNGANGSTYALASASRGGRWAVEVVANDGMSRSEPRRSSEFVLENRPPAFTSQPPAMLPADGTYRYAVTAVDPDGDPLRFELASAPDGMTMSPAGAIEWKFPGGALSGSRFHVVVKVSDGRGGETTQTIDLSR
ncbi:MAG: hypothetical protein U0704_07710 [Candidatus Eisenbacteria bacterium]